MSKYLLFIFDSNSNQFDSVRFDNKMAIIIDQFQIFLVLVLDALSAVNSKHSIIYLWHEKSIYRNLAQNDNSSDYYD